MSQSAVKPFAPQQSGGGASEWEAILNKLIGRAYTITLGRVESVQAGGAGPVGFLTATDLVQQQDETGEGVQAAKFVNVPYFRLQGGANAVIMDPEEGDVGLMVFARRDISEIKRSKQESPPPSDRSMSASDGLWIGGLLNGAPEQFIQFHKDYIEIKPKKRVLVSGELHATGNISSDKEVSDKTGSMQTMRDQYNGHAHGGSPTTDTPMT